MTRRGLIAGLLLWLDAIRPRPRHVDRDVRVVREEWTISWDTIGWDHLPPGTQVVVLRIWTEARAAWIRWEEDAHHTRYAVVPNRELEWHTTRVRQA